MARYIDADWIYEKVKNRYRVSSGIEHRCERDLLDLICEAPTADVVPKREVEDLIGENESLGKTVNEASELIHKLRSKVEKSKTEVAREILAEIEEGVKAAISALQFANPTSRKIKHETLLSLMRFIKTIEKKYTEVPDEKG